MESEAIVKLIESDSYTSNAYVSKHVFKRMIEHFGPYIFIQSNPNTDINVLRLSQTDMVNDDAPCPTITIDHWPPSQATNNFVDGSMITIGGVSPITNMRVVQYLELVYLGPGAFSSRPKVPIEFLKSLLYRRVLSGEKGTISLKEEGCEYGQWAFTAHYQKLTKSNASPWAGIIDKNTLISIHSLSTCDSQLSKYITFGKRSMVDCIGKSGQPFLNLVAMVLGTCNFPRELKVARSILLQGANGTGKTTLVRLVAKHLGANLLPLDGLHPLTAHSHTIFQAALRLQPAIIFLDDIELIFPASGGASIYRQLRELSLYLEHLELIENCRVALVGTVSNTSALHIKVRKLFEEEISLQPHDRTWTLDFLSALGLPEDAKKSLVERFGQNISRIISTARRFFLSHEPASLAQLSHSGKSTSSILVAPQVAWSDIGGCRSIKQKLIETVVWPIERPQMFQRLGICPPSGMILYGPPGTGKTMLAKAASTANGCNLISVSASDLVRAEFGESEKEISRVFDTARASQPCMIFIDEFQSLFGKRSSAGMATSRMTSQLLMELDSISTIQPPNSCQPTDFIRVFVLAATNALEAIDSAFLQPGRFGNVLYVGLPDEEARQEILLIQKSRMPWDSDIDVSSLVTATEGYSAASIVALCRRAAIKAMQRLDSAPSESECINIRDFDLAFGEKTEK